MSNCKFCDRISAGDYALSNEHSVAFLDSFPLSTGHTLVVPFAHEADLFELPRVAQAAVWDLVGQVRSRLVDELSPDGFNIGLNVLPAAGQTIPHAHVHVIPRTSGDVPDPRGGVRWVLPGKAAYWLSE